jgi:hypothetical protein
LVFPGAEQALKQVMIRLNTRKACLALPTLGWDHYFSMAQSLSLKIDQYALGPNDKFDWVIINPVWRIVPDLLQYPNTVARRGSGQDGLDMIRELLRSIPSILSKNGVAVMRFEMPMGVPSADEIKTNPQAFVGTDCHVTFEDVGFVSVQVQSRISAATCAHLNPQFTLSELQEAFALKYQMIGATGIRQLKVELSL